MYKDEDKEKKSLFQQPGLFTHQLINNIKKTKNAHIEKEIQEMPYFNKNTDLLSRWLNSDDPKKL